MRILTISAHPDDETLGCGGTLLKHQASGDSVYWLIVTQTY
ncbi:MAG TPA: PIG-L family deacetylase, partial [Methylophaga sp.]|nr:PIG-L family deacetylase [Methylophaga sp.]